MIERPFNPVQHERLKRLRTEAFGRWDPPWPPARNAEAWRALRDQAFAKLKSQDARDVVDDMKRIRAKWLEADAQERGERQRLEALGPEVRKWLDDQFARLEQDCDYVDNRRWADWKKSAQVRRYMKRKDHGCCGYVDEKIECPINGRTYLVGFNYGH